LPISGQRGRTERLAKVSACFYLILLLNFLGDRALAAELTDMSAVHLAHQPAELINEISHALIVIRDFVAPFVLVDMLLDYFTLYAQELAEVDAFAGHRVPLSY
jgi:hypothetical protein